MKMKKWFRILLSLLLVLTLTGAYLSPVARAEDSAIPLTFTEVVTAHTNSDALTLKTNITFSDYGVSTNMDQLGWCYPSVGTSESNSAKEVASYPWSGTWVYFSNAFTGLSNPTYFKFAAGTTFTWGGVSFKLTDDFIIINDGSGWSVYEEPDEPTEPIETTKVTLTGVDTINVVRSGGLNGLTEMYIMTDTTWNAGGEAKGIEQKIKVKNAAVGLDSITSTASSNILKIAHWSGASMTEGAIVKIPAGLQFTIGDVTYEIAETFGFTYNGSTGGTVVEAVPLSFTGIFTEQTAGANLSLTTNIDFATEYAFQTFVGQFAEDNQVLINDTGKDTIIYYLWGKHIFFEGILSNTTASTTVKIQKGTWLSKEGYVFEVTDDFNLQYDGATATWRQVFTETDITLTTDVVTTETGVAIPTGLDAAVAANLAGASFATSAISINGDATKITSATINRDGNLAIDYQATAGDILKVAAGSTLTSAIKSQDLNVTNESDLILRYNGTSWTTHIDVVTSADITISNIFVQSGADMFLTIDLSAEHVFTGKSFTTSDIVVTKSNGETATVSGFSIHLADTVNTICYQYTATEGDIISFRKGGVAINEANGYEICFANAFAMKFDGSEWTKCETTVTVGDILVQQGTELYLKTDLADSHDFAGHNFTTSDIVVTASDGTKNEISKFNLHASDGVCNILMNYTPSKGDILTIKKGGTAIDDTIGYKLTFANGYALQYDGNKWVAYVESVQVSGIEVQAPGVVYLKTNLGASHVLHAGNTAYSSSDITVTKSDGTAGVIQYLTVDNGTGAISVGYTATEGDILFVKSGGTAINTTYGYTMKFTDGYILRYNGTAWEEHYTDVTLSGITAQSATELYLTTGLGANHELYAEGTNYSSSDIRITKADGSERIIGKIALDYNSGALYMAVYEAFEEGDVCRIQANGTATNATKKIGVRFREKVTLYFENGEWHVDSEGPEFYYQDKLVTNSTTVTVTAGRSKASFEKAFYAKDEIKGIVNIAFSYAEGALDSDDKLCAGTWNVTMTAEDGHGNTTAQTVAVVVEENGLLGDSDYDDVLTVSDLVRLKKAIANSSADVTLYDMNGDGVIGQTDAEYMRSVLIGVSSIVDGQVVALPTYNGSAVLFADCPPSQLQADTVQGYFDAGFTHMQMTEDYTALTYNETTPFSDYMSAMKRIQKYGEVMVRNQIGDADYFQNDAEQTVGNYTIPIRNLTTEFADMGITSFYYDDEPAASEFDEMHKLITWHNTYNKGAMFHVNLLPSYGSTEAFGGTFKQYIQAYVDNVLAKVEGKKTLSIDNYPLRYERGEKFIRYSYLSDFLTVAQAVKKFNATNPAFPAEVSFCIQSYGVESGTKGNRQIESLADIRFQTNMAIAMGARNMEYYMYNGTYAMVDSGEKTSVYDYVKTANKEVQAWDHVFTSFDWQGTKMFGDTIGSLYEQASSQFVSSFAKLTASATGATVVSEFIDKSGNYAYMAVNATEPSKGQSVNATFTLTGAKQAVVYQNGIASVKTLTNGVVNLTLGAGEGAFCIPIY